MADPLDEALRDAARKGMTHLTLYPVVSADGKTTYWHARSAPSTGHSYVQITSLDPVDALVRVLLALPKAPKRAAPTKITAAVTEPEDISSSAAHEPKTELEKWLPQA